MKSDTIEDLGKTNGDVDTLKPQILAKTKANMTTVGSRLKKPTQPGQATSFFK